MTLSRSSVVAMMRGVYCPLATWIATSSEPKVKTTNDSVKRDDRAGECLRSFEPEPVSRPAQLPFERLDDDPEHPLGQAGSDRNDPQRRAQVALDSVALLPVHVSLVASNSVAVDGFVLPQYTALALSHHPRGGHEDEDPG